MSCASYGPVCFWVGHNLSVTCSSCLILVFFPLRSNSHNHLLDLTGKELEKTIHDSYQQTKAKHNPRRMNNFSDAVFFVNYNLSRLKTTQWLYMLHTSGKDGNPGGTGFTTKLFDSSKTIQRKKQYERKFKIREKEEKGTR